MSTSASEDGPHGPEAPRGYGPLPVPTGRWFLVAAAAVPLAAVHPLLAIAILAAAAALLFWDGRRPATLAPLRHRLHLPARVSLHETIHGRVELWIEGEGARSAAGLVSLEVDPRLAGPSAQEIRPFRAAPRAELTFELPALARGQAPFHGLHLCVRGPLGLALVRERRALGHSTLVVPGLAAAQRVELNYALGKPMAEGRHRSRRRDDAGTLDALREYQRGDDPRRIDWKASARRGHTVVRLLEAERRRDVMIAIDLGRSQREVFEGRDRLDHSLEAALCLSAAVCASGDSLGLLAFGSRLEHLERPARRSLSYAAEILARLSPEEGEPDYRGALLQLANTLTRRSLVVLFSDAVDLEVSEPLVSGLQLLSRRHRTLLVALRSPAVEASARAPLQTPRDGWLRGAVLELELARATALLSLSRRGVEVLDVPAARAAPEAISRYLELKRRDFA